MTVTRVVMIRSGETDWNRAGRWQGWVGSPLNAHGRQQVAKLAQFVRHIGMSALYSSDLRRAKDTARILADLLGFEPIFDARFRERHIGYWQGLTLDEMRAWYPQEYDTCQLDPDAYHVPGGESRHDVRARIVPAFEEMLTRDRGETMGLVTHTTAMKVLLKAILPGLEDDSYDIDNSSCTTIARDGADYPWQLVTVDDVGHLEGLKTTSIVELEYAR